MNIKTLLLAASLACTVLAIPQAPAATEIIDQVVAIVDDDVIMASELRERVASVTENLNARGIALPPEEEIIRETLDRLILENIQLQMGTRVGVRISDAQLNNAVMRIASQNGMDLVSEIMAIYDNYGYETEVIVASVRSPMHVVDAALIGADIATIPYKVIAQLAKHPLTDIGMEKFLADWEKRAK